MATNLAEWMAMLGKTYDAPEVQAVRARHGLTGKGPRVVDFGSEEVPSAGVALMLIKTTVNGRPGKGVYGITFYSRAKGERVPYAGELPHGLTWGESQAGVRARLGAPKSTAQLINSDVYELADHALSVEYLDDAGTGIKVVQVRQSRPG